MKNFTISIPTFTAVKNLCLLTVFMIAVAAGAQSYCDYDALRSFNSANNSNEKVKGMLEQTDGKLLIYGLSYYGSSNHFEAVLLRLNADQVRDTTFGQNGMVSYKWNQRNTCVTAALQNDGKILIGGTDAPGNGFSSFLPYLSRLNADGSVDSSFANNGSLKMSCPGAGMTQGIKQLGDGKIMVLFTSQTHINGGQSGAGIARVMPDGTYDSTFYGNGWNFVNVSALQYPSFDYANGLFPDDGSMIMVGSVNSGGIKPWIIKWTADGVPDTTFGNGGFMIVDYEILSGPTALNAILTKDQDILITATSPSGSKKYLLFKVDGQTGTLDSSFGTNGIVESTAGGLVWNRADALAEDTITGTIYVVGRTGDGSTDAGVWKISAEGTEIPNCNGSPFQTYPLSYQYAKYYSAALFTSDGRLQLAGTTSATDTLSQSENQGDNFMIPVDTTIGTDDSVVTNILERESMLLTIYPNPATHEFKILFEGGEFPKMVRMFSPSGQLVLLRRLSGETNIDISHLPSGVYFVELTGERSRVIKKLVKRE